MIILTAIEAIVGWFALMFIGTNLVGRIIPDWVSRRLRVSTYFFAFLVINYIFLLAQFLSIGVAIAAIMLMGSRIPDVLWEIEHGKKTDKKDMPRGLSYTLATVTSWASLPVLWWALYSLQRAK